MAYRCQSCGHFASLDEPELSVSDEQFDGSEFTASVSASYPSQCCYAEVATAEYSVSGSVEFPHKEGCAAEEEDGEYDIDVGEASATDRFQTTDRHGKPIKNFRYQRHYYGVEVSATVTCKTCGADESVDASDESGPPEEAY